MKSFMTRDGPILLLLLMLSACGTATTRVAQRCRVRADTTGIGSMWNSGSIKYAKSVCTHINTYAYSYRYTDAVSHADTLLPG